VSYIECEEAANERLGHVRQTASPRQTEETEGSEAADTLVEEPPVLVAFSSMPGVRTWLSSVPQLDRRVAKFLAILVVGGVWVSLGIAYLLTHLYRVQHFPAFVWYVTLQFIPRPLRGLLFIASGITLVALSLRAFSQLKGSLFRSS
jgi:hypothetical protein